MPSTYEYSNVYQTINNIATTIILYQILKWIIIIALLGVALYFIIRTTCKYQAKKNAEAFDYDYLAVRTAEEITKRIVRLEQQKRNTRMRPAQQQIRARATATEIRS